VKISQELADRTCTQTPNAGIRGIPEEALNGGSLCVFADDVVMMVVGLRQAPYQTRVAGKCRKN